MQLANRYGNKMLLILGRQIILCYWQLEKPIKKVPVSGTQVMDISDPKEIYKYVAQVMFTKEK